MTSTEQTQTITTEEGAYGAGRDLEITVVAERLTADDLDEHELDPARPWAIRTYGVEYVRGPGGAVLSRNGTDMDPDGEWMRDMRATEPTAGDLAARLAEEVDLVRERMADRAAWDRAGL